MKDKINEAITEMKSKVSRDSKHIYRNNETGISLQGVSSVSSIVPKDWLAAWGAKECVKFLGYTDYEDTNKAAEMLLTIKNSDLATYLKILKDAKGASGRKGKKAMADGKVGHSWLENLVKARISGSEIPALPDEPILKRALTQFLDWEIKSVDYWIVSEAFVYNEEKSYAGQLDAICVLKTGELCLVDFKFATHIDVEYFLQTGGYAGCFEKYGITFNKRIIIRLAKTLEKEEYIKEKWEYVMVPNNIEICVVPTSYEDDYRAFCHALVVKSWINRNVDNKG